MPGQLSQVKALAAKPDSLSLNSRTCMVVEGENQLPQVVPLTTYHDTCLSTALLWCFE